MTSPEQLGHELRFGSDPALHRRRTVAGLVMVTLSSLGLVALYQLGILRHLPEPPLPGLNAEKVNGSAEAYRTLATPDAVLGLGSYAVTLGLAAMGGRDRAQLRPWLPLALAAKAAVDVMQAAKLTRSSWVHYHAFSLYSLTVAAATFATLPLVVPEAAAAVRRLGQRK
jgi:hypothetical protein